MENASKALIIAGAILISIIIITLGVFIVTQGSEMVKSNSDLSGIEITKFNEQFLRYEGSNVRGSEVNSLLNTVVQNNIANIDDESKQIIVNVTAAKWTGSKPSTTEAETKITSRAQTGKTYEVECDLDDKSGLVTSIAIKDAGTTGGSTE